MSTINYVGDVDPTQLLPKYGESYVQYEALKPIVDLANQWRYSDVEEALETLRKDPEVVEEEIHLSYMLESEVLIIGNQFEKALERMNYFLNIYPNDLQALFLSALVSKQLEKDMDLIDYIEKLANVSPSLAEILSDLIIFVDAHIGQVNLEENIPADIKFDAIVLYGNRMEEDGSMSEALESRLEKTLSLLEEHPNANLLASGGATVTPYSESDAMMDWLEDRGISKNRIYMDEVAKDTVGNIFGYEKLLEKHHLQFDYYCCVTSLSHLARAWMGFVQGLKRNEIPFEGIYAAAPETPSSIEVPEIERSFTLFTVVRSAEWLERRKFTEFENEL